jgi:phenylalanyl-tRNA synthetase beta chain
MKVPLSWIREFVDVTASAEEIGALMGLRGLPLESLEYRPALSEHGESKGDDVVMDFEVTANRPDCMSIRGIAREIAAAYQLPFRDNVVWRDGLTRVVEKSGRGIPVTIQESELCGRYVGIVADVTSIGPSPDWMQQRLQACGVRPISNVVDITNYVLLEMGQPMHAFDYAKLAGPAIVVRRARAGEKLTTLDGKTRALTADMLVIADAERPQAIGGVMGGADSEVSSTTRQIVFESAYFNPRSVRATSKKLGLKTEASMRFERGADPTVQLFAALRACELLAEIGAGTGAGPATDAVAATSTPDEITLPKASVAGLLGMEVPDRDVMRILQSLGFDVEPSGDAWSATVPSWRVDIHRKEDVIEEIGRHYGYEHLPTTFPGVEQAPPPSDARIARDRRARTALLGMGFSEAITLAFIEAQAAAPFLEGREPVTIANPLSELFTVMRPSLLPGIIDALSHNRRHGNADVRLFEIGTRFSPAGETRGAAFAWTGLATADHWSGSRRPVDFSDLKGVAEQVLALFIGTPKGVPYELKEIEQPYLVAGRAASIAVNGTVIGSIGQLLPAIADARGLPAADEVYVGEINLDALTAAAPAETLRVTPLPRYPFVVRDVSILVADTLSAETVRGTIRSAAQPSRDASAGQAATLVDVREFDRYQGKGVPDGKVSLSFRLTFQSPERTLTDDEVSEAMLKIVTALKQTHSAEQR